MLPSVSTLTVAFLADDADVTAKHFKLATPFDQVAIYEVVLPTVQLEGGVPKPPLAR
jgi:hypothetical protein